MTGQIEELKKLYTNKRTYLIPEHPVDGEQQASITLVDLSLEDAKVMDMKEDDTVGKQAEVAIKMLALAMGEKEEDVAKISFRHLQELMDAFSDANRMEVDKSDVKNLIKRRQEQMIGNEK